MAPCAAVGCKNRHSKYIKGITFHRFPLDPYRRKQWILAVRRANWTPSKCSQLCSLHFEEHMIDRSCRVLTQLKKTAVPTIFKGVPPLENQEWMKPKTQVLEDILNDKNRILVVPEGLDVKATFYNSDDTNNVVVIKDEKDLQTVLNCGNEDDTVDNRAIVVSDGRNRKTQWCGNVGEDIYNPNGEIPPYDPSFAEESLKSGFVDFFKIRALISYDPDFYVRRVRRLEMKIKKFLKKKKILLQTSRRKRRRIAKLEKDLHLMKKKCLPPKCSERPIVHVISH